MLDVASNAVLDYCERGTLTIPEASKRIGISTWSGYQQAKTGSIGGVPVIKIGRRLVVLRAALERVLSGDMLASAS